jgi:hypothetical protein
MEPRNYEADASATPPEPPESPSYGFPTDGNPLTGTPATWPGAHWIYKFGEEIRNFIVNTNQTPNDNELDQLWKGAQSLPDADAIGQIGISMGSTIPAKALVPAEQELIRANYPDLWAWVQLQSNLIAQATKDGDPIAYSAYWGDGDGATTFTMPNLQGLHVRSFDNSRGLADGQVLFEYIPDENKSHTHSQAAVSGIGYTSGSGGERGWRTTDPFTDQGLLDTQGGPENTVKSVFLLFYIYVLK